MSSTLVKLISCLVEIISTLAMMKIKNNSERSEFINEILNKLGLNFFIR